MTPAQFASLTRERSALADGKCCAQGGYKEPGHTYAARAELFFLHPARKAIPTGRIPLVVCQGGLQERRAEGQGQEGALSGNPTFKQNAISNIA